MMAVNQSTKGQELSNNPLSLSQDSKQQWKLFALNEITKANTPNHVLPVRSICKRAHFAWIKKSIKVTIDRRAVY